MWLILFTAVCMWGYYLYYLFMAGGDYPRLTEDAQRLLLFAGAVGILIYTLSLRLAVKKLKAVPTILLVISCLVIVCLFSTRRTGPPWQP